MDMIEQNVVADTPAAKPIAAAAPTAKVTGYRHGACGTFTVAGDHTPEDKELPCATCQSCPSATEFSWE